MSIQERKNVCQIFNEHVIKIELEDNKFKKERSKGINEKEYKGEEIIKKESWIQSIALANAHVTYDSACMHAHTRLVNHSQAWCCFDSSLPLDKHKNYMYAYLRQ